jgi:hypothetical protein
VEIQFEERLERFIEYMEAEIREQFSGELHALGHELELPHEGAAMVLAWFGLAALVENADERPIWVATGRLTSPRALQD